MAAVVCKSLIDLQTIQTEKQGLGWGGTRSRVGEEFRHRRWREIDTEPNQTRGEERKRSKWRQKKKTAIE